MTDDELTAPEKLANEATIGPWHSRGFRVFSDKIHTDEILTVWRQENGNVQANLDADFIAASREAIPALIAEVRSFRTQFCYDHIGLLNPRYKFKDVDELKDNVCEYFEGRKMTKVTDVIYSCCNCHRPFLKFPDGSACPSCGCPGIGRLSIESYGDMIVKAITVIQAARILLGPENIGKTVDMELNFEGAISAIMYGESLTRLRKALAAFDDKP